MLSRTMRSRKEWFMLRPWHLKANTLIEFKDSIWGCKVGIYSKTLCPAPSYYWKNLDLQENFWNEYKNYLQFTKE